MAGRRGSRWMNEWMDGSRWAASQTSSNAHRWRDGCQLLGQVSWWNQEVKRKGGRQWGRRRRIRSRYQSPNQSLTESNEPHGDKWHSKQVLVVRQSPHRDVCDNTTCSLSQRYWIYLSVGKIWKLKESQSPLQTIYQL